MERISESDIVTLDTLYLIKGKVEVYKVQHIRSGETLCMKKIFIENPFHFNQTCLEFLNLAKIHHESIMTLRSVDTSFTAQNSLSHVCIFTDFYHEGDLGKYIETRYSNNQPFTEEEILNMLHSLITVFAFLQSKNIAHRDIKPENIFIKDRGTKFIVGDFGSSKLKNDSLGQTLVGTPLFLSPRLRVMYDRSNYNVDHDIFKSDVFSLGMSTLYMATFCNLKNLFKSKTRTQDIKSLIISIKSRIIQAVLTKMLEEDESQRFDFLQIQEFLNSFQSFICDICGNHDLNPRRFDEGTVCETCYSLTADILNQQGRAQVVKKHHGTGLCNGLKPDKTCTCGQLVCVYCKNLAHVGISCLEATRPATARQNYYFNSEPKADLAEGSYFLENSPNPQVCVVCSEFFNNDSHERCVFFFTRVELS